MTIISCFVIAACTQSSTPAYAQLKCIPTSIADCNVSTGECNAIPIINLDGIVYLILDPDKSQAYSYKDEQLFNSTQIDFWAGLNGRTLAGGHGTSRKQEAIVWSAAIDEAGKMSLSAVTHTESYLLTARCELYAP